MKDYARIIGKITSAPWMITPDALKMMLEIFDAHLSGTLTTDEIKARMAIVESRVGEQATRREGKIGVLNITGPIFPKANLMTEMSGATSVEQFRSDFRAMMSDDSVDSILLDVDSPGGFSDQIEEMAAEIRQARESKPVYSIANTAANSAAYYLASQATKMYATPSGQIGSIGTYMVHVDESRREQDAGIDKTIIKAGRFKALTEEALTSEGRAYLQEYVNEANERFISDVAEGRNLSVDDVRKFADGRVFNAASAYNNRMIDGMRTFDQVVESIGSEIGGGQQTIAVSVGTSSNTANKVALDALVARQSYDADKEHSEPGTGQGGEPTPREPPEEGDKAIEGGWRRDPPPIAYELEVEEMDRAWLEARAASLGVNFSEELPDDELAFAITERIDEIVVPLNNATVQAHDDREFHERFPERARQLDELLSRDRQNAAHLFAEGYARFDGSNKGFSTLVRDLIEEAHMKVATRQFTGDDLKGLLDAVAHKEAVVGWGETGSSRSPEDEKTTPTNNFVEDRKRFAELVRAAMTDDNMDRNAAIEHVSKMNPELAQAYLTGHTQ